jgi:FMN reductase
MVYKPLIVAIGGTLRPGSSTERALQICLDEAEKAGARTQLLRGTDMTLPPYNPEEPSRSPEAKRLVELVRESDGIILGSPGYHGSISGLVKNAIDYTEDLRDDKRIYLDGRAVGCIACGAGWQSIGSTLATLRSIVHALRGWPTPLGVGINTAVKTFDPQGRCLDETVEAQLRIAARQVIQFIGER